MGQVMVIQDFTQIQVQTSFYQDLILCIYFFEESATEILGRSYFHFVAGGHEQKNNIDFVVAVWKYMIQNDFFANFSDLLVFSDGGPKHFKYQRIWLLWPKCSKLPKKECFISSLKAITDILFVTQLPLKQKKKSTKPKEMKLLELIRQRPLLNL